MVRTEQLLKGFNVRLFHILRADLMQQVICFQNELEDYSIIKKFEGENIKEFFKNNEKNLKKDQNLPETEDCEILCGYHKFEAKNKMLISADEHFWGYKLLILQNFNISVIEDWNCLELIK